ncbi:MAG TPA: sulfotransferase [Longimicrobiales bacterium]|nr:sulfotransferase [Longimicrobiales bacterium]
MDSDRRLKVLYIAGNGRSGSTLLDVILGQVPGFFAVGEVRNMWDYGILQNRPCGCGKPFGECPTWQTILGGDLLAGQTIDPAEMATLRERFARTKRLLPMLLGGSRYVRKASTDMRRYLDATERLYWSVAERTGASVIVDSSKWPTYAFLLDSIPSIDLHVLHLVRDPRACAFSWTRKKESEPGVYMDRHNAFVATSFWVAWNPAIQHFWGSRAQRYKFLTYEDFVTHPRRSFEEIVRFVGADVPSPGPFVDDHSISMAPTHSLEGNATKFISGSVTIRSDTEWQSRIPMLSKAVVSAMTWPWLLRYGYWGGRGQRRGHGE